MIWRNLASNLLSLLVLVLVVVAGAIAWARHEFTGPGPSTRATCVQVAPGASLSRVSETLKDQGVVSNAYVFRAGTDYADKAQSLRFGSYMIPPGASMQDVLNTLTAGGPSTCGTEVTVRVGVRETAVVLRDIDAETGEYVEMMKYNPAEMAAPEAIVQAADKSDARLRIAIAEGVTSWQIAQGLKAATFMSGEIAETPPEGSLAPDTYDVRKGADRQALLDEMTARQATILLQAWEGRAPGLPYASPEEALIMASIVEKETGVAAERPQVASVFVNRLERGMRLETDPTVIYGVTKGESVLDRGLRRSELQRRTPYNTYQIDGLPPTPIANPGRAAIQATMHPDTTEYIFFVADGSGGHAFSRTLDEHNAAVARWREIERQQGQTIPSMVQGE